MCVCMSICYVYSSAYKGQKRAPDFLELKLQAVVSCLQWVLGMKRPLQEKRFLHCWADHRAISPNATPSCLNIIKHWSFQGGHTVFYILRKHKTSYPFFFFFFWSVFYGLDVKIQSPSNATCTRNILPVPELACSRPQLLTFIKLYFMKILLQKAHNTVRCMLFPSNVK